MSVCREVQVKILIPMNFAKSPDKNHIGKPITAAPYPRGRWKAAAPGAAALFVESGKDVSPLGRLIQRRDAAATLFQCQFSTKAANTINPAAEAVSNDVYQTASA